MKRYGHIHVANEAIPFGKVEVRVVGLQLWIAADFSIEFAFVWVCLTFCVKFVSILRFQSSHPRYSKFNPVNMSTMYHRFMDGMHT